MSLKLRRAELSDARRIAEIHVAAWREAYAGLVPAAYLDALDVGARQEMWSRGLARGSDWGPVFVVGPEDGPLQGFARCGPARGEKLTAAGFGGEFFAVYVLESSQRRGAGRALMTAMARALLAKGVTAAGLWVLRDNPRALGFYEALGGRPAGIEGVWDEAGVVLPDLVYGWRNLEAAFGGGTTT